MKTDFRNKLCTFPRPCHIFKEIPDTRNELYKVHEALKFKTDYNSKMYEGPEKPNQFEDFKTKCRRADTRQIKDTATGC